MNLPNTKIRKKLQKIPYTSKIEKKKLNFYLKLHRNYFIILQNFQAFDNLQHSLPMPYDLFFF